MKEAGVLCTAEKEVVGHSTGNRLQTSGRKKLRLIYYASQMAFSLVFFFANIVLK